MRRIIIFLSLFAPLFMSGIEGGFDESYYKLPINEKRKVFAEKINEMLDIAFEKVLKEREFALNFLDEGAKEGYRNLDPARLERLVEIQQKYRIKNLFDTRAYSKKIDTIPKSMGIAQAMVESATGTSRFTKEANNLFGEWTFKGRGLVPKQRPKGKTHKVRIFDSLQESVESYLLNLNRNNAYEEFRTLRLQHRKNNKKFSGLSAISTMKNYASIKEKYIEILRSVITKNGLSKYD